MSKISDLYLVSLRFSDFPLSGVCCNVEHMRASREGVSGPETSTSYGFGFKLKNKSNNCKNGLFAIPPMFMLQFTPKFG